MDRVPGGGLCPGPSSRRRRAWHREVHSSSKAAAGIVAAGGDVLYASGEESPAQVRLRASRLGLLSTAAAERVRLLAETEVGRIVDAARDADPTLLVVDSIQTATTDELDGPAGSVGQVRQSALRLTELAKDGRTAVILVGHVTKDGTLAGPKTLEHLVDAVLTLEGERYAALRSADREELVHHGRGRGLAPGPRGRRSARAFLASTT
jgi:DNA repair protein RadA/Sms